MTFKQKFWKNKLYDRSLFLAVKNDYWGNKPVDDIGYLFQTMLLLFGVDTLSILVNGLILFILTNVILIQEFNRIMAKYWHFIAIKFALGMITNFATKDINMGMDATVELRWITYDGRISLINSSNDLSISFSIRLRLISLCSTICLCTVAQSSVSSITCK